MYYTHRTNGKCRSGHVHSVQGETERHQFGALNQHALPGVFGLLFQEPEVKQLADPADFCALFWPKTLTKNKHVAYHWFQHCEPSSAKHLQIFFVRSGYVIQPSISPSISKFRHNVNRIVHRAAVWRLGTWGSCPTGRPPGPYLGRYGCQGKRTLTKPQPLGMARTQNNKLQYIVNIYNPPACRRVLWILLCFGLASALALKRESPLTRFSTDSPPREMDCQELCDKCSFTSLLRNRNNNNNNNNNNSSNSNNSSNNNNNNKNKNNNMCVCMLRTYVCLSVCMSVCMYACM